MDEFSSILLTYLCVLVGGLIWEFFENICVVDMKKNKRQDSPINAITDILLVFLGGIVGCCTYKLWEICWIFNIILLGGLLVSYGIARLFTEKNFWRKKKGLICGNGLKN